MQPIVIVGSGLAGYTIARELRKLNAEIPVTLVCADSGDFYSKPMLSNALQQNKTPAQLVTTPAATIAQQLKLTLMPHTLVERIDTAGHRLYTSQGSISYSKLVLAIGAEPVRPALEGDGAEDVQSVNHLDDYAQFHALLNGKKNIAIIGGGLIGCEFANDLAAVGHAVTVIHPQSTPLHSLLPEDAGRALAGALEKLGVQWKFNVSAKAVEKTAHGFRLTLSNDEQVNADVVLSAIGLRPNTQLARLSEIVTLRGIVVDQFLQTNASDVYALGDCAQYDDQVLPYVLPIMNAARALVKTLTGTQTPVTFPFMPIVVKTTAYPVVAQLPAASMQGQWQREENNGLKLSFIDTQGRLAGFVLTGERTKDRAQCLAKMQEV